MDPFGKGNSSSDENVRARRSASDQQVFKKRFGNQAHVRRGKSGWLDRRTRRRVRMILIVFMVAIILSVLVWRRINVGDHESKKSNKDSVMDRETIESIIGELAKKIPKADTAEPLEDMPPINLKNHKSSNHINKEKEEKPPSMESEVVLDNDPLDVPINKLSPPAAASQLAQQLTSLREQKVLGQKDELTDDNRHPPMPLAKSPHEDFQKIIGMGEESIKKLNENINELSRKLMAQNQMVSELQKSIAEQQVLVQQKNKQSTMGDEILKQLGVRNVMSQGSTSNSQTTLNRPKSDDGLTTEVTFKYPPISTIVCSGSSTVDRVCKIKNLCFDPSMDRFFLFKDSSNLEVNVPRNRSYLVDTTSIDGHNKFFFDYSEVHPDAFKEKKVHMVDKTSFLVSRFHALNIMHTVHDDFLGLYGLHRMYAAADETDERFPFSRDNNIVFLDSFESIRYDYVFQFLTDNPLQFRSRLREKYRLKGEPICFRNAIVGNSKIGSWYSYGFMEPQGPIPNKTVSGLYLRDAARFLMNRMSLPGWDEKIVRVTMEELNSRKNSRKSGNVALGALSTADSMFITLFTRQLDRLIVNEAEVISKLQERFGLPVKTVRMEDMHLGQQAAILRSSAIAVGVHGSALILGMFLPPGAMMIELFPYAVPADNYTPYKTMCNLPGMRLAYRSWTNKKVENNYPHPERPPSGGGIKHLPLAEQEKILNTLTVPPHLCCRDPYWLFRIYQDTRVDTDELIETVEDAIPNALHHLDVTAQSFVQIRPGVVENIKCRVARPKDIALVKNETILKMEVSWDEPWNGVIPDKYGIWVHQPYQEFFTNGPSFTPPECAYGSRYDMWIRSYVKTRNGDGEEEEEMIKSQYSDKVTCYCQPEAEAKFGEEL